MSMKKCAVSLALAASALGFSSGAHAVPVAVELALLVDVSGSVDSTEYNLQRNGYVNAFNSANIQNAIASLTGGIAVTYIEWSGATQQAVRVGWTHITNAVEASAFATALGAVTRTLSGQTAPGSALNFTTPKFSGNGFEGDRWVIDVSGDGAENDGANTANARDAFLAAAAAATGEGNSAGINGLAIGGAALTNWYAANIQGGTNSFVEGVDSFADFNDAIARKLHREITGQVPEPGSLALLGLAVAGLMLVRRRKNA